MKGKRDDDEEDAIDILADDNFNPDEPVIINLVFKNNAFSVV